MSLSEKDVAERPTCEGTSPPSQRRERYSQLGRVREQAGDANGGRLFEERSGLSFSKPRTDQVPFTVVRDGHEFHREVGPPGGRHHAPEYLGAALVVHLRERLTLSLPDFSRPTLAERFKQSIPVEAVAYWAATIRHAGRGRFGRAGAGGTAGVSQAPDPKPVSSNHNEMTNRITETEAIRLGVSTCLLGEEVRHDGGHKRDPFLIETLGDLVEWVPVCPEVELGLGTPREPIHLVRDTSAPDGVRLTSVKTDIDLSSKMRSFSRQRVRALARERLSGFVLKRGSPSCGMERVKVWSGPSPAARDGRGLFAAELMRQYPNLPVEAEGRLHDPGLRESFFDRIFMYGRLRRLLSRRWTIGTLVTFHTEHKFVLMAHSLPRYRELGRLVAVAKTIPRAELARRYENELMEAMRTRATRRRHTNVLMHAMGHLKKHLDGETRKDLLEVTEDYRLGHVPRIVPITLIRHHARRLDISYLLQQVYLDPGPKELMLRNHV